MNRFRWPFFLLVLLICLPVAVLALDVRIPFFDYNRSGGLPRPSPVPDGDQEMAWLHTTTNGTTWERFVSGAVRAQSLVPGLKVDDSRAFIDRTTAVPELVLSMPGREGRLRIRWYKLTSDATTSQWVEALADRSPAPLAVIGGGSSDRAVDLARALQERTEWRGERPLLFLTTATADEIQPGVNLIDLYPGRTFRFCFTNRQMAEAVLDLVWSVPGLRPETFASIAPLAVGSGMFHCWSKDTRPDKPHVFSVSWQDDPFSTDLHWQFTQALSRRLGPPGGGAAETGPPAHFSSWGLPYSVGGFLRPNQYESRVAESILEEYRQLPPQRSLLVLPSVAQPARRLLRALCENTPRIGTRMVAVTGDGVSVNSVYRDGEFQWPVQSLPVPLVLFAHNNPLGWTAAPAGDCGGYDLRPPTSTDEVLHFAELVRAAADASFAPSRPEAPAPYGLVTRADHLAAGLRARTPALFDPAGNRLGGSGEHVVVLWPHRTRTAGGTQRLPRATLEAWTRGASGGWALVRSLEIDQRQYRSTTASVTDDGGAPE